MNHSYIPIQIEDASTVVLITAATILLMLACVHDNDVAHITKKLDNFERRFNAWDDRYDEWEDYFDDWDDRIPEEEDDEEDVIDTYHTYCTPSDDYVHYIKYKNGEFMLILPQNKAIRGQSIVNVFLRRETRSTRGHVQMTYIDLDNALTTVSIVRDDASLCEFLSDLIDE